MADIANIGFKADTSELKDATTTLNQLAPAAAKAQASTDALAKATLDAASAAAKAAAGYAAEGKAAAAAAASANLAATAAAKGASASNDAASAAAKAAAGYTTQGKAVASVVTATNSAAGALTKAVGANDNLANSVSKSAKSMTDLENVIAQIDKVSTPFNQANAAFKAVEQAQKNGLLTTTQYSSALTEIGRAFVTAGGTAEQFESIVSGNADRLGTLKKAALDVGIALVGAFAIGAVLTSLNATANAINDISNSASKLGTTTASMQGLGFAATMANTSVSSLTSTLNQVNETMTEAVAKGKGSAGVFKFLGLSAQSLLALPLPDRLEKIADKMNSMNLSASTSALVLKRLGDSSGNLSNLFAGGGDQIRTATDLLDKFHGTLTELQAANVNNLTNSISAVSAAFMAFKEQIVAALAPIATPILNAIALGIGAITGEMISLINGTSPLIPVLENVSIAMAIAFGPLIIASIVELIAYAGVLATAIGGALVTAIYSAAEAMLAFTLSNPFTAILFAITTAIAAVFLFRDNINQALGIDVVQSAENGANAIINTFVGAYKAVVATWDMLPAALGDAVISAANATIFAVIRMVNSVAGLINGLIDTLNSKLGTIGVKLGNIQGNFKQTGISNPYGEKPVADGFQGPAKPGADDLSLGVFQQTMAQQMNVNNFAGLTTAAPKATAALTAVKGAAIGANGALSDLAGGGGKKTKDAFGEIVTKADETINKLQAQKDAIGLSAEAAATLKYQTELLNEAQQKNINLSDAQRAQLMALGSQMGSLEADVKKSTDAFNFAKDTTKGFFHDIASGLEQGKSLWQTFGDAVNNVLNKIIDKLLDQVVDALFTVNKAGTGGSAGGGILSSIGSWFTGLFAAKGKAFTSSGVSAFANGGAFTNSIVSSPTMFAFANGGALGVMGEAGPEAVMPLKRGPDGSLGVQMHSANGGSGGNTSIVIAPVIQQPQSTGNDAQDQKNAQRLSDSVTDSVRTLVRQEIVAQTKYGGAANPRGVGGR